MIKKKITSYEDSFIESYVFPKKQEMLTLAPSNKNYINLLESYSYFGQPVFSEEYFKNMRKFRRKLGLNDLFCFFGLNKRTKNLEKVLNILGKMGISKEDPEKREKILNNLCGNIIPYDFGFRNLRLIRYTKDNKEKIKIIDKTPINLTPNIKRAYSNFNED